MNSSALRTTAPFLRFRLGILPLVLWLASGIAVCQAVPANYTDDLPSVAKVEQQIQGTDPTDTLERQVAVFEYLQTYIQRIKETRDYRGPYTPAESQLLTDYAKAQYDLQQSYNKNHTQQEIAAFGLKEGQYSLNNALNWIKQLEGNRAAVAYTNTESELAAAQQRNNARIQKGLNQGQSGGGGGGLFGGSPGASGGNSAGSLTADQKRCLELGDTYDTCIGPMNGMVGAIAGLLTAVLPTSAPAGPPPLNGVVLVGLYHSRMDLPEITLQDNDAAILSKCGTLADKATSYAIRKSRGATQIVVSNEPDPIVLTLQSDGSLAGPGTIQVKGQIIVGYNNSYSCVRGYCNTTSNPVYQAKMDSCTVRQLAPQPLPASKGTSALPAPKNGFWIAGDYAGSSGMQLSFANQFVTLDCGQAHVKAPYTVTNMAAQFVVQIQNKGGPFQLTVAADNTLRGSGSTAVDGRLVSAVNGSNVTFTPHSETCPIGSFSPKGTQNTMAANSATP